MMRELAAKIRNLFSTGDLQKRYDNDGRVQVMTHTGRVLEKQEAFPYGFYAKAKSGRVLVFCQGGNYNDFEILPVLKADDVTAPELEEGDAALYTANGGVIIARDSGDVEITGKSGCKIIISCEDGKVFIGNKQIDMCNLLVKLIDEIKGLITTGSPASQVINEASKQKLELYKNEIKKLYAEAD
jgi:phage gp45-like